MSDKEGFIKALMKAGFEVKTDSEGVVEVIFEEDNEDNIPSPSLKFYYPFE